LSSDILSEVCEKITGGADYTADFVDSINKGRLAILEYGKKKAFISFSDDQAGGRNSALQSFPTALVACHKDPSSEKSLHYYFLPSEANVETDYFKFMYRLMKTADTNFINEEDRLQSSVVPFNSTEDMLSQKTEIRSRNSGNLSSYMTVSGSDEIQIFGKTYGASKYETTLLALAARRITTAPITLFEIQEKDLRKLPRNAREVILSVGINIITSNLSIEREHFQENNSLRSPRYGYNLLEKLGQKQCAFCNCEIPQIIHGAHIWNVADIKKSKTLTSDEQLDAAIDGENGIWLCQNHHGLLDANFLALTNEGEVLVKKSVSQLGHAYMKQTTTKTSIERAILSEEFNEYLSLRNSSLSLKHYQALAS